MSTPMGTETPPKSRNWLIIAVVAVVICCLCLAGMALFYYLWTYGDQLFGLSLRSAGLL